MTVHLVTFSDESMSRAADLCVESAKRNGVDLAIATRWAAIRNSWAYHDVNQPLASAPRGPAFWSWKPFVIAETIKLCGENDTLIYADAGVEFINNVSRIIERMDQDVFLFGNNWEHAHWCKRDVIEAVWLCAPRDVPWFGSDGSEGVWENVDVTWTRFRKQCQASVIFFRVSDYSRQFVKEWLDWCLFEGGRLIDDSPSRTPNHPEFQEHRHDQAILTTLAYREGIKLHWWPASYNDGAFTYERIAEYAHDDYPILFNHHRRRNHEFQENAA